MEFGGYLVEILVDTSVGLGEINGAKTMVGVSSDHKAAVFPFVLDARLDHSGGHHSGRDDLAKTQDAIQSFRTEFMNQTHAFEQIFEFLDR